MFFASKFFQSLFSAVFHFAAAKNFFCLKIFLVTFQCCFSFCGGQKFLAAAKIFQSLFSAVFHFAAAKKIFYGPGVRVRTGSVWSLNMISLNIYAKKSNFRVQIFFRVSVRRLGLRSVLGSVLEGQDQGWGQDQGQCQKVRVRVGVRIRVSVRRSGLGLRSVLGLRVRVRTRVGVRN